MNIYFPALLAIMAAFFLGIGSKVAITRRPLFLSSRIYFAFLVLALSPQLVNIASIFSEAQTKKFILISMVLVVMYVCLFVYFWLQMKGYMAIGVTDEMFRKALHFSLNKNNLPFEEQLTIIKLPSENSFLQISMQSWIGVGQIKLRKSKSKTLLPGIIAGMNEYCVKHEVKQNHVTSVFYILMGVCLFVIAGVYGFPQLIPE